MLKLGRFEERIQSFGHDFEKLILIPRLQLPQRGTVHAVHVGDNATRTADKLMDISIKKLFAGISLLVGFLHSKIPRSITSTLAALLIPNLIQRIITNWLIPGVTTGVEGIIAFQEVLNSAVQFARTLDSYGCPGGGNSCKLKKRNSGCLDRQTSGKVFAQYSHATDCGAWVY